ncbi:AAA family ATPase [Ignatzschineria sp. LJL83]
MDIQLNNTERQDIVPQMADCSWLTAPYQELLGRYQGVTPPHALMIYGIAGIGKKLLMNQLTAAIFCRSLEAGNACGKCQSCRWLASGFHPDLFEIHEDGEIKIEGIRKIQQFARLTSETGNKIVLIKEADRMNLNAANSLLKVLEEPPADLYFILESSAIEKLPITVRSRCQKSFVKGPDADTAIQFLRSVLSESDQNLSEDELQLLLEIVHGAPFMALSYLNSGYSEKKKVVLNAVYSIFTNKMTPTKAVPTLLESEELTFSLLFFLLQASFNQEARQRFPKLQPLFEVLESQSETFRLIQYEKLIEIYASRHKQTRTDWALMSWFMEFVA